MRAPPSNVLPAMRVMPRLLRRTLLAQARSPGRPARGEPPGDAPAGRRLWFDGPAAVLAALVAGVVLWQAGAAAVMQPDSASYLAFAPSRTIGYPWFLRLARHLPGGLDAVPALQLALYAVAAVLLAGSCRRLARSNLAGAALLLLLLGNSQVTRLCLMILSEPLFLCVLMLLLALASRLAQRPGWQSLALASLVAGLAVLVRPAGYALAVALPVLAWWGRSGGLRTRHAIAAVALPYLVVLGLGMAGYHAAHGAWRTQSFLGSNLLGKAAAAANAVPPGESSQTTRWMAAATAPAQAAIDRAPSTFDRFRLLVPYYDVWRQKLGESLPDGTGAADDPVAHDRAMLAASLEVIAAAPAAYLADVALNLAALWWLPDAMTQAELARFRAFIDGIGPLPDLGQYPPWHQQRSDAVVWGLRCFMMLALASSVWWIGRAALGIIRRATLPALARLGFVAAMIVHASFLLTAAVQAGIPRYTWAMWPALGVLVAAGLVEMRERALRWRRASDRA